MSATMDAQINSVQGKRVATGRRWTLIALGGVLTTWAAYRSTTSAPAPRAAVAAEAPVSVDPSPEQAIRAAAVQFVQALAAGDVDKAQSLTVAGPADRSLLEAMAMNLRSARELKESLSRRFAQSNQTDPSPLLRKLNEAQVEIDGDHAELAQHRGGESLPFERTDGRWLLNAAELGRRRKVADPASAARARAAAATRVAAAVNEGRYRSAQEALADHARQSIAPTEARASGDE